ncbi:MAG: DUF5123 domain-containing protein [Marinoscillum sp.]
MRQQLLRMFGQRVKWLLGVALFTLCTVAYSQNTFKIPATPVDSLERFLEDTSMWSSGDIVELIDEEYTISGGKTVNITKGLTLIGATSSGKRPLVKLQNGGLRLREDSLGITIKGINFDGYFDDEGSAKYANALLRIDQAKDSIYYDIVIEDVEAWNLQRAVQLNTNTKTSVVSSLKINNCYFHDFNGTQYVIDPQTNYVKNLVVTNSTFAKIPGGFITSLGFQNVDDNRPGRVEQMVLIDHNTFDSVFMASGRSLIQMNDPKDGSITLMFSNNIVSGPINTVDSRPFRLGNLAGTFTFKNNHFHDFATDRTGAPDTEGLSFNLGELGTQTYITVENTATAGEDPMFKDEANGSYLLPSNSPLQTAGALGEPLGDPRWGGTSRQVGAGLEAFVEDINLWNPGDTIFVTRDETITGTIDVFQELVVVGDPSLGRKPVLRLFDNGFRPKVDSINITIMGIAFNGLKENEVDKAPYILRFDDAASKNFKHILIQDVEAYNTQGGVQLYKNKNTLYESVTLDRVYFHDMETQWALDPTLNAVKKLRITNSTFSNVFGVLKNPYFNKDGTGALGAVAQNFVVDHNTFYNIGGNGGALIQINDPNDGSVSLEFTNNIVSTVLNDTLARPFLINADAGSFTFKNSVIHDFESTRDAGIWNFSAAEAQANVTATDITSDAPGFKNAANGSFLLASDSPLQTAGLNGEPIGDPRWGGSIKKPMGGFAEFVLDTTRWNAGDTILVTKDEIITVTIDLFQEVTIMGDPSLPRKPVLRFYDNGFGVKADSINITLMGFDMNGLKEDNESAAPYILRFDRGDAWKNWKNILIEDVEAYNFKGGVQLYKNKNTMYESVTLNNVYFHDMVEDFVLDPKLNAVKELNITNSTFHTVKGFVKNAYNNNDGTNVFGSVAQDFNIHHNTFYNVVSDVFIQQNDGHDGSVSLDFTDNIVSTLLESTNSRPFRIAEDAGTFTFNNNVFHSFESDRDEGAFNLGALTAQANVTAEATVEDDPEFVNAANGNFMLKIDSKGLIADLSGTGFIGAPRWVPIIPGLSGDNIHPIPNTPDSLEHFMANISYWNPGDTILLVSPGTYIVNTTIDIYQEVVIMGDPTLSVPPTIRFFDNGFGVKEDSISITLKGFNMNGLKEDNQSAAPYILRFDRGSEWNNWNNILIEDMEAYNFKGGVQLYKNKNTMYENVTINRVFFHDMVEDFVLDPKLNVVKELKITNSTFHTVKGFVKNAYNNNDGANDAVFGTVAQHFVIDHNTFYNVVSDVFIQQNDGHDNSVTLDFTNNIVSTLLENTNSRPFRIAEDAGTFNFTNSVFHDFKSSRDNGIFNLDSTSRQANVNVADTSSIDPMFAKIDVAPYNFTLPLNSTLLAFSTEGSPIGDPRWFPEVGVDITELDGVVSERDTIMMEAIATFGEGADLTVTWSVLSAQNGTTGDATIDATTGKFIAVAAGDVAVVAQSNFAASYKDTLWVSIEPYIYVETINLKATNSNGTEISTITSKGGSLSVNATIQPFDAPDKSITWTLSDDNLATLQTTSATAVVLTATASGVVTVTATANDGSGISGSIDITLENQRPVTSITVSSADNVTEIRKGETLQMSASVEPDDADVDSVGWSVNTATVASIDEDGLLTALAAGTVEVKASATDNSFKFGTLSVTVLQILGSNGPELVTVYPNPSTDFIQVTGISNAKVEIVNLSGQVLMSKMVQNSATFEISNLRKGLYIMRIKTDNDVQTMKFTKN